MRLFLKWMAISFLGVFVFWNILVTFVNIYKNGQFGLGCIGPGLVYTCSFSSFLANQVAAVFLFVYSPYGIVVFCLIFFPGFFFERRKIKNYV